MKIGIDKIGFYTPAFYVDMVELAEARNIDPNKYTIGIGQDKMAFAPITQDSVTMGANAARQILNEADLKAIDMVILATESGIDESKAGAVYIHRLLGIQPYSRAIEIKEACYGATAGINLAKDYVAKNPESKVLVIGSDIARYGLSTAGEATQGAGAVAMVISANPRCIALQDDNVFYTEDIMDFWRPVYSEYACVEGKYSTEQYIHFFDTIWTRYTEKFNQKLEDFAAICFHLPYTKMGKKALDLIIETAPPAVQEKLLENYRLSTLYSRNIGNIYTGSLYLSFISLLDHQNNLQENDKIGFFSYGSGAVGEFFHGVLQPGFKKYLQTQTHEELVNNRSKLAITEYETKFKQQLPKDGSTLEIDPSSDPAEIMLTGIQEHRRQYVRK